MDIENLDITLSQTPGGSGYSAQATTAALGNTSPRAMNLGNPDLLGTLSLVDIFAPPGGAASLPPISSTSATTTAPTTGTTRGGVVVTGGDAPAGASPFVKALRELQRGAPSKQAIVTVGTGLYNALPGDVRDLYNKVWGRVQADQNKLLRVRLHFFAPEVAMLPWEFLKIGDTFLGTRRQQSLIRYPEVDEPAGRLGITGKLKVLIWTANPAGTAPLQFTQEVENIQAELVRGLGSQVQIDMVRYGGPRDLLDKLREGYHVLHYIGHGILDRGADPPEGKLAFERTQGAAPTLVTADQLAPGLLDNPTLQLVFLNSCEGATSSVTSAYASLAFNLARFVPAVIAMQYRVLDASAIIFAQEFYRALSGGRPLDRCVTEGRNGLIAEYGQNQMDWGVPALFTRAISDTVAGSSAPVGAGTTGGSGGTNVTISGNVSGQVAVGNQNTQMMTPPPTTNAGPLLPPATWAALATNDNGLRLTPQGRRLLTNTLAGIAQMMTSNGRDQLLRNLPPNLQGIVRRDTSNARVDLGLIIESVESFGQLSSGNYALIVLVDTAADVSAFDPSMTVNQAPGALLAFSNGLRQKVGLPPVSQPLDDFKG